MDTENLIENIKFFSHYTIDEIVKLEDEYYFKDPKSRKEIGQLKVRVIKKIRCIEKSPILRIKCLKILESKYGIQKRAFVPKENRIPKKELHNQCWSFFNDATKSVLVLHELIEKVPKNMEEILIELESYVLVLEDSNKNIILEWLKE